MTKIHLVRHGYTPNNHAGYTGQYLRNFFQDDEYCPLEKKYGIEQVKEAGRYLSSVLAGKKTLFIVSPYYRTRETLHYILENNPNIKEKEIIMEKSLIEINQGLQYGYPKNTKYDFDNLTENDLKEIGSLPEYEQELLYNRALQHDESKKGKEFGYVPFYQGDSVSDVNRRTRHFSKQLKKLADSGEYDDIVIVTHNAVLKSIYRHLKGKPFTNKLYTASTVTIEDGKEDIQFNPKTMVPKEYIIDTKDYNNYKKLYEMQKSIDSLKQNPVFQRFMSGNIPLMPIEEDCNFIKQGNMSLAILPENNQSSYTYIDSLAASNQQISNNETSYYILEGTVAFFIKDGNTYQELLAEPNKVVTIPPNREYYYRSNLPFKMISKRKNNIKQQQNIEEDSKPRKK